MPIPLGILATISAAAANLKRILTSKQSGGTLITSWESGAANTDVNNTTIATIAGFSTDSRRAVFINKFNSLGVNSNKWVISSGNDLLTQSPNSISVGKDLATYVNFFDSSSGFWYAILRVTDTGTKSYERYVNFSVNPIYYVNTSDSSGNAYYIIGNRSNSSNFPLIWKLNSAGTSSWQRVSQSFSSGPLNDQGYPVSADTNGTRVNYALNMSVGASNYGVFGKIDADGTSFVHGYAPVAHRADDIATIDSNFWAGVGNISNLSSSNFIIKGSQTSNSYNWARKIDLLNTSVYNRVGADSTGAVYYAFRSQDASTNWVIGIIKFDSSGNTVWQRQIRPNPKASLFPSYWGKAWADYDANNMLLSFGGWTSGSYQGSFNILIPKDGSGLGTFSSSNTGGSTYTFIYENGIATISNHSISPTAIDATVQTASNSVGSTNYFSVNTTTIFDHINNY
jgi:hypothetical protein